MSTAIVTCEAPGSVIVPEIIGNGPVVREVALVNAYPQSVAD
jgi:hypothetical protein